MCLTAHLPRGSVLCDSTGAIGGIIIYIFIFITLWEESSTESLYRCLQGSLSPCPPKFGGGAGSHTPPISKWGQSCLPQNHISSFIHQTLLSTCHVQGPLKCTWDPIEWGTQAACSRQLRLRSEQPPPSGWRHAHRWPKELRASRSALKSADWSPGEKSHPASHRSWAFV